nr:uORF1 [Mus musculus]
MVVIRPH